MNTKSTVVCAVVSGSLLLTGLSCGYVLGLTYPPASLVAQTHLAPSGPFNLMGPGGMVGGTQPAPYIPVITPPPVPGGTMQAMQAFQPQPQPQPQPSVASTAQHNPFDDPRIAHGVLVDLGKLHAVDRPVIGKPMPADAANVVSVFFDPRCPYCHQLFQALDGKVPVRWIPIPVLDKPEEGVKASMFILDAPDAKNAIETAFAYVGEHISAPDAADNHSPADVQKWLDGITIKDAEKHWLQDNLSVWLVLHKVHTEQKPGVPTVIVPHVDGTLSMHDGFDPGDENGIAAEYAKGR